MIRCFKLINGEEIITAVLDNSDLSVYLMKEPCVIVLQQNSSGGVSMALAPYQPYCVGNILLIKTAIASEGDPNPQLENEYRKHFGSGIVVAPASILLG